MPRRPLLTFWAFRAVAPILAFKRVEDATPIETSLSANLTSSSPPFSPLASPSITSSSPASATRKGLSPKDKTAIDVFGSGLFVALTILGALTWHRLRKRRIASAAAAAIDNDPPSSPEHAQPYPQQKSELDAEETRKHELHAEELRYEVADNTIHEMQGEDDGHHIQELPTDARPAMPTLRATQELRGAEHSKELEAR